MFSLILFSFLVGSKTIITFWKMEAVINTIILKIYSPTKKINHNIILNKINKTKILNNIEVFRMIYTNI